MNRFFCNFLIAALTVWGGLLLSGTAKAHPHAWIDLWVEVVFDESGAATGLRQVWLFDDFYTAYAIEGMDEDGDGKPDTELLAELVRENIESLAEYSYFTKAWVGGTDIKLDPVTEMSSDLQGKRLAMTYYVPFAQPVRTDIGPLIYSVYDPTYYIEILHADTGNAVLLETAPAGCSYNLEAANPKEEEVALAANLLNTETAGDGLGVYFAERVTVRCSSHG